VDERLKPPLLNPRVADRYASAPSNIFISTPTLGLQALFDMESAKPYTVPGTAAYGGSST